MLNFPIPYHDELVYSAIARAGLHMGIVSPKQLLDEVFDNRNVIATVDLPSHMESIARWFPDRLDLSAIRLAYEHTLFPIYAPFTTESRRQRCLEWMVSDSRGSIHLALGIAASRIKRVRTLRYCPVCLKQQLAEHGEYYWTRQWQVFGADCCLEHGVLLGANLDGLSHYKHQFFPASPVLCPEIEQQVSVESENRVARQTNRLLSLKAARSAGFAHWSAYYRELAGQAGCRRGQNIRFDAIKEQVLERWPCQWLRQHGLAVTDEQTCWLRTIFRKHRKSFSYLEHIVVLDSFLPEHWWISDVLDDVSRMPVNASLSESNANSEGIPASVCLHRRERWMELVTAHGTKKARELGGGGLYTWLYRHDKGWLLKTNSEHRLNAVTTNSRVDWQVRDFTVVRQLICIRKECELHLDTPRQSMRWYLSKTGLMSTIEKNLTRLPLTYLFFNKYCEDISEYQIRRITRVVQLLGSKGMPISRWRVLRMAGLSEERLTEWTRRLLVEVVGV